MYQKYCKKLWGMCVIVLVPFVIGCSTSISPTSSESDVKPSLENTATDAETEKVTTLVADQTLVQELLPLLNSEQPLQRLETVTKLGSLALVTDEITLREKIVPVLRRVIMSDPESVVRLTAIEAIGRLGPEAIEAHDALVLASLRGEEEVNLAAIEALKKVQQWDGRTIDQGTE